jgi:hypothetical protein
VPSILYNVAKIHTPERAQKRVEERQREKGKEVQEQEVNRFKSKEVKGRGRERAIKLEEGGFHEEVI